MTRNNPPQDEEDLRLSMIRNVFSYDELGFVPAYKNLGKWVSNLLKLNLGEKGRLEGAVGIAVPVDLKDGNYKDYAVEFVEWECCPNSRDDVSEANIELCKAGRLHFSRGKTALGKLMSYMEDPKVRKDGDPTLAECAKGWLEDPVKVKVRCFENPKDTFGDDYKESFAEDSAKYMMVYPIISDDGKSLLGMFGFDIKRAPPGLSAGDEDSKVLRDLNAELSSLKHILEQFLWSYYTYLDTPKEEYGWPWSHEGRVFSPTYYFKLVQALREERVEGSESESQAVKLKRLNWLKSERFILIYADADGIKGLNDQFGHAVGNVIIRGVGAAMWRALPWRAVGEDQGEGAPEGQPLERKDGVVIRWGGDEFIIVIPLSDGFRKCRRSRVVLSFLRRLEWCSKEFLKEVGEHIVEHKLGRDVSGLDKKVGLSVGWEVVKRPNGDLDGDRWLRKVENAMYECKKSAKMIRDVEKKEAALKSQGDDQNQRSESGSEQARISALSVKDAMELTDFLRKSLWRHHRKNLSKGEDANGI